MSSHTLRWTRRAVRRLDQISSYIAQEDPEVVARIVVAVDNIASHPAMGRVGRSAGLLNSTKATPTPRCARD
jgi:plasmid stabilization system protein ParE